MSKTDAPNTVAPPKWMLWTGRVLSALPVLLMAFSASMKLMHPPEFVEQYVGKFGYPESTALPIGLVEIACAVLYAIPQTAVLGAIVMSGYLGGAAATHVRIGDAFLMPIIVGIVAWAGLCARDTRLRALLPLRRIE